MATLADNKKHITRLELLTKRGKGARKPDSGQLIWERKGVNNFLIKGISFSLPSL